MTRLSRQANDISVNNVMKELVDGTECPMEGRGWLAQVGARTLFIEPGSLSENGYNESFNGKLRDECLGDLL
jgi:hypothetical protein